MQCASSFLPTLYLMETLFSWMFCRFALEEDTNDGKTKGVASELQDDGEEDGEDEENEEDADGAGDPAARGSNEEAGAAAINEKLFLGRKLTWTQEWGDLVAITCEVPPEPM